MPFSLSDEQLALTESLLSAKLPSDYREAMKLDNGGQISADGEDWELYPIKDTTDRKRLARTCNHIAAETEQCHQSGYFPENAVTIAHNGSGDQLVYLRDGDSFQTVVYRWFHEAGTLKTLAQNFDEIK